jgi:hypothetical protein
MEDLGLDGKIVLKVSQHGWEVTEWIYLSQNRNIRRAVMSTVMNLQFV